MKLLEVKNLTVQFGEQVVLDHLSFSVEEGAVVAIVGPNGSGKTVLLKALLGLLPYEGDIQWVRTVRIGYVPQRFEFDRTFPLTVEEAFRLKLGRSLWKDGHLHHEISQALSRVGASHLIERKIGVLSGGELQRVLIGYALLGKPDVLLFDEPATGIDIGGGQTIYSLIHDLAHKEGMTVLLVSHDLDIIYKHATSVFCVNRKLVCRGKPAKVLTGETLERLYGKMAGVYQHNHEPEPHKHGTYN